ncbi:hypothetical protein CRUP_034289 [Coryphaenoides rupestris]|nr:hypothetical protein CRUP_034289 [Coryphaenoides rupestris]
MRPPLLLLRPAFCLCSGLLAGRGLAYAMCAQAVDWKSAKSIYEFSATDIDGNETRVNYTQFAEMHVKYAEKGLRILGFPCNQFGGQEPGTDAEIKEFAKGFNAKFDLFSKIEVNGDNAHPLWKWMKAQPKGSGLLGKR